MSHMSGDKAVTIHPVVGIPEIEPHHDLDDLLAEAISDSVNGLQSGDVVMVTHKIVSKAEGAVVDLSTVEPTDLA